MPVVKVGVGIPGEQCCSGALPWGPRTWLVYSLPGLSSVWLDVETDEWLPFARQNPHRGQFFQLSCLCKNPLRRSLCAVTFHVLRRDSLDFPPLQQTPGLLHGIQG